MENNYKDKNQNVELEVNQVTEEEAKGFRNVRVASVFIVILSLVAFLIITYFTGFIGEQFGKVGETIALGIVGLLLIFALYKNNKEL